MLRDENQRLIDATAPLELAVDRLLELDLDAPGFNWQQVIDIANRGLVDSDEEMTKKKKGET